MFTLQVLSNIWVKTLLGEERRNTKNRTSRRGRQQAWKLVGCCPHASGMRKSKFRRHQHGQAPAAVGG